MRDRILNLVTEDNRVEMEAFIDELETAFNDIRELLKMKVTYTFADLDEALDTAEDMSRRLY